MKTNHTFRVEGLAKKIAVTAIAAAGLALMIPATPAAAANSVDCHWPQTIDEYARITTSNGLPRCYANAGAIDVNLGDIAEFHSGNNKVTFFYTIDANGYQNAITLEKWQTQGMSFGLTARVTALVIW
ncbi:hypothetical protein NMG29_39620 [Streptomyces cocklensis]|uniref:Streptomyces killer toxin-like beta/gamma crystallin domain-containing protein n=1 Tax=Actinacidiphila cocklensis TaxID=887465 RepID=A0A9W4E3S2_9ACTN|nr:beta/gamma crystallin domain-containing protein [Actinacidiphila cocklensis]MDD1064182.1 hypothetical protein [Actinacidiphila cocklensis]WSX75558.1 hypothetical protein OH826_17725 [Streptomyces sp. NBC_00899]CAG6398600.1 exported hypothetical protein [Actinacidiphila cocklensis]